MTIAELNSADRARFVDTIGWVFEDSPWVASRAWDRRPFDDVGALHEAMTKVVSEATRDERLALLRAHPDLGTRASMSDASVGEQNAAGLGRLTDDESEQLRQLNRAYREKFEFPFLFAVKGSTRQQILDALNARLPRTIDDEVTEALRQVSRIARFRLDDLFQGSA